VKRKAAFVGSPMKSSIRRTALLIVDDVFVTDVGSAASSAPGNADQLDRQRIVAAAVSSAWAKKPCVDGWKTSTARHQADGATHE
jgi:hypothetical protein